MSILEQLSSSTGARGEQLEIALAAQLATHPDPQAVADLVDGLTRGPDRLRGDCVKVLYELGKLNPDAISAYAQQFLSLLRQKNNRLVWGGMIALATIAPRVPQFIFTASDEILRVMERGSVITRDAGVAALAEAARTSANYRDKLLPVLFDILRSCRPSSVAQYAEKIAVALTDAKGVEFDAILQQRSMDLTPTQQKRVNTLSKQIRNSGKSHV